MFLAKFTIENEEKFGIYVDNFDGWKIFHEDTFSPLTKDITILRLKVKGKTYHEKRGNLIDLAIDYQHDFSCLSWSYGELAEIEEFFYRMGKRYGLLREFRENAIC